MHEQHTTVLGVTHSRFHGVEYLIEAAALGTFMISATLCTVLLEYPGSPVRQAVASPTVRRCIIGLLMGLTAIAIIYSKPGRRSGAHMNPATTLTFLWLGKIAPIDAACYIAAQLLGGVAGMAIMALLPWTHVSDPAIRYIVTTPGFGGRLGVALAFVAEVGMAFGVMLAALTFSNDARLAPYTGLAIGALVAVYIACLAPISGMSINPARTLASATVAGNFQDLWVYMVAPPLGMLAAAALYRSRGCGLGKWWGGSVRCAKLCHLGHSRCIFRCGYCVHPTALSGI
jgi:aquaporin Z